jgi:hypothetical protein
MFCSFFAKAKDGKHIPMGSAVFDVEECLGVKGNTKAKKLQKGGT